MEAPSVLVTTRTDDIEVPCMGTLEAKFLSVPEHQSGIQFSQMKPAKKKKQKQPQILQNLQNLQNPAAEIPKKKKKKKKKQASVQPPQTPSASAKKKVSFSPSVVSTVGYTWSKQEYDRTPIMGIFNHFCDCCMQGIEGARFHCQLCEDFDMCQACFVSQGADHYHGQQAFTCPELDELDADDEGDEGDEGDFGLLADYLASISADDLEEVAEDPSLDALSFQVVDDVEPPIQSSVRLADENGPLEQIIPTKAASLEEETPISVLFPKAPLASTAKPKKQKKPTALGQPQKSQKTNGIASSLPTTASSKHAQPKKEPSLPKPAFSFPTTSNSAKKSQKKKPSAGAAFVQRSQQKAKKSKQPNLGGPAKMVSLDGLASNSSDFSPKKQQESTQAAPSKKRVRADGGLAKVKKQKLPQ